MKGNEQVIERLNARLADELAAILQYVVHSEMCANWGYQRLHKVLEARAREEMRHAEHLIARILFLEGIPIVDRLGEVRIGADVEAQHRRDREAEEAAVRAYNEDIRFSAEAGDNGTRALLEDILKDEEEHLDWIEAQLEQIRHMGIQDYLAEQMEEGNA